MALTDCTLAELSRKLQAREVSAEEVTKAFLERISTVEPKVHAFLHVEEKGALEAARKADALLSKGQAPALCGVPVALKDLLCTQDMPTTCASRMLENFRPPYDATVVRRLREAGAVLIGKVNMDEFAMGSSTENSAFGATRNPWDLDRVPGGSSGGSAAAVAAGECAGSLGSDTGGSIRQPAALCGVVGLKPTYGRVSRFGVVAFASSLDQVGPLARTVEDTALLFSAIAGKDPQDATSVDLPLPDFEQERKKGVKGLRIGLPKEYFPKEMDAAMRACVLEAARSLERQGAVLEDVSLPHTEYALAVYYLLAPSEASSNLARYDGVRYGLRVPAENVEEMFSKTRAQGFGAEVKRRIMLGTYALSSGYYDAYYLKALKVRRLIKKDFDDVFRKVDVLLTPTTPTPAFRLGEKTEDPLAMYFSDIFTIACPVAGLPGLSFPCGFLENLPVGAQLIGKPFDEGTLFRTAEAYQSSTDWHKRRPTLE